MFSQVFALSPRGDILVYRDYRGDVVRGIAEIFFRKLKTWKADDAPPFFNVDNVHFAYIRTHGLYFVCTTKFNVSPVMAVELLTRIARVIKDYCGILSEESLRLNFSLVYELLDEVVDFGYPQMTTTETLKAHVFEAPAAIDDGTPAIVKAMQPKDKFSQPSSATNKPVIASLGERRTGKQQNEIYVDLLERLTVIFNSSGVMLKCEVDGALNMKSYLTGSPEIRMGLNQELVIGRQASSGGYGVIVLDDCNFHETVNMDAFESQRMISFLPPEGEFTVMNYRCSGELTMPFRVFPFLEDVGRTRLDLLVRVRADLAQSHSASNMVVKIPIPKSATSVSHEFVSGGRGQTFEFNQAESTVSWRMERMQGGTEETLRVKGPARELPGPRQMTVPDAQSTATRKEIGAVNLNFEIANYNCSGMQIKYLKVYDRGRAVVPNRWVRYISYSNSYVCRV